MNIESAFLSRVPVDLPADACWPWPGNRRNGYGRVLAAGQQAYAHRVSYETSNGAILPGMTVDHECHNRDSACRGGVECPHRSCVNPAHLTQKTAVQNSAAAAVVARTGRCRQGHPVSGGNVYKIRGRKPICRECHLRRQMAYEHKDSLRDAQP